MKLNKQKRSIRNIFLSSFSMCLLASVPSDVFAIDHPGISKPELSASRFTVLKDGKAYILTDETDNSAVKIATGNLSKDFGRVSDNDAAVSTFSEKNTSFPENPVIIATYGTPLAKKLIRSGAINEKDLKGKNEKYIMSTVKNPLDGIDEALVIIGSDRRGTVYGIYELSEQIGVSPWYDWADVPVTKNKNISIERGSYTAGEPAVKYRGIFLNDEAPCLTSWVENTYGTKYGDHRFYARVNELILRLRGNFLWPAMWSWAFYADDPQNSKTADEMGIIMGTSHHEPMARNHQEWARNRKNTANGTMV